MRTAAAGSRGQEGRAARTASRTWSMGGGPAGVRRVRISARSSSWRWRVGGVGEEGGEGASEGVGVELGLEELGDDAAAGDEVGHGDGKIAFAVGVLGGGFVGGPDFFRVPDE